MLVRLLAKLYEQTLTTMFYFSLPVLRGPGGYSLTYFDEFIDDLLTKDRVCDIILPRLTQRAVLEETEGLAPRRSLLVRALALMGFTPADSGAGRGRKGRGQI